MPEAVREGPASDGPPLGPVLILLPALLLVVLKALRAVRMTKAPTVLIVRRVAGWRCLRVCGCGWGRRLESKIRESKAEPLSATRLQGQRQGSHDEKEDAEMLVIALVRSQASKQEGGGIINNGRRPTMKCLPLCHHIPSEITQLNTKSSSMPLTRFQSH